MLGPGSPVWVSVECEEVKCGRECRRTRTWEWLRWREPAAILNERPILLSERILHKDYNSKCSVDKKNIGRESQVDCREAELIGDKPLVVKVTLTQWSWKSSSEERTVYVL
jgi:heme/copper-type cytochrome/quinol oxidase subunit 2